LAEINCRNSSLVGFFGSIATKSETNLGETLEQKISQPKLGERVQQDLPETSARHSVPMAAGGITQRATITRIVSAKGRWTVPMALMDRRKSSQSQIRMSANFPLSGELPTITTR